MGTTQIELITAVIENARRQTIPIDGNVAIEHGVMVDQIKEILEGCDVSEKSSKSI